MAIVIVNHGSGNLNILRHKLSQTFQEVMVSDEYDSINKADFFILSGVGHFATAMQHFQQKGILERIVYRVIAEGVPILGICLGMQLFCNFSEEGNCRGMGLIDAETQLFRPPNCLIKVPHVGWSAIAEHPGQTFFAPHEVSQKYYFCHSYHVLCHSSNTVLSTSAYNELHFVSSVRHQNILGFQFHPEKSHAGGMELLTRSIFQLCPSLKVHCRNQDIKDESTYHTHFTVSK